MKIQIELEQDRSLLACCVLHYRFGDNEIADLLLEKYFFVNNNAFIFRLQKIIAVIYKTTCIYNRFRVTSTLSTLRFYRQSAISQEKLA